MVIDKDIFLSLIEIPWFKNCRKNLEIGIKYNYEFVDIKKLTDSLNHVKWDNIGTDEFNNLYAWFKTSSICLDWNRTVSSIRKEIIPEFDKIVKHRIKELFLDNSKKVLDSFHYDLLMIIMIKTISKKFYSEEKPIFYDELLKVYQVGCFPCGWYGKYPKGKLLIY